MLSQATIFLKILKTVISKFNDASFETGIVPDSFKLTNLIPVYKKGISFSVPALKIETVNCEA